VLASGAEAGDPPLPGCEDLALVVVERRTARRLVVGDEAVELVEGGQRVGLLESPVDWVPSTSGPASGAGAGTPAATRSACTRAIVARRSSGMTAWRTGPGRRPRKIDDTRKPG